MGDSPWMRVFTLLTLRNDTKMQEMGMVSWHLTVMQGKVAKKRWHPTQLPMTGSLCWKGSHGSTRSHEVIFCRCRHGLWFRVARGCQLDMFQSGGMLGEWIDATRFANRRTFLDSANLDNNMDSMMGNKKKPNTQKRRYDSWCNFRSTISWKLE